MPTTPLSTEAQQVIYRAISDSHFREALVKNTVSVLHSEGLGLSDADITALKKLKPQGWGKLSTNELKNKLGKPTHKLSTNSKSGN